MNVQLQGIEAIDGTYPFDLRVSVRTMRINKFLWSMTTKPENRPQFLADPEGCFERAGLTEQERDLIRKRDWQGMIHYGVNFFVMEKIARLDGIPNAVIYAGMRAESLEDFLKTRNVPEAR
ncbi:hypothetical protein [Arenibaculum pallidiluteum]|uniref:hypothetical protein n=1 Tax=Arenibaculum pallidiluteum TaxID=2812559 RepID=UPI001A968F69|nr:hypothetical protein [Arenibaculum pallidiluteum]